MQLRKQIVEQLKEKGDKVTVDRTLSFNIFGEIYLTPRVDTGEEWPNHYDVKGKEIFERPPYLPSKKDDKTPKPRVYFHAHHNAISLLGFSLRWTTVEKVI